MRFNSFEESDLVRHYGLILYLVLVQCIHCTIDLAHELAQAELQHTSAYPTPHFDKILYLVLVPCTYCTMDLAHELAQAAL